MSVELRPLGVACNISCHYCYQNPQRDAGNFGAKYSIEAMKEAVEKEGGPFTLFGGEALLVPIDDLEKLWKWGLEKYGQNGVQTNGVLITDAHIELFKKYKVHVGVSIDGPGELNDIRWAGSLDKTRASTEKTERAIEKLIASGILPSLIVTLHRNNATKELIPIMKEWLKKWDQMGIRSARLHVLESENAFIRETYALSEKENIEALLEFASLEEELKTLKLDLFNDMKNLLLAQDKNATCVWRACDPFTTSAVRGVEGFGQRSNCGRTNKDGIDFVKSEDAGFERYIALYSTPQEFGGCQDCRFFLFCKGQCPGTAIDNDWRNRTEHCDIWKELFKVMEERLVSEGKTPLSMQDHAREQVEQKMIAAWIAGYNPPIMSLLEEEAKV